MIEFELVEAKGEAKVSVRPSFVELLVDMNALGHLDCTQITMQSGTKFFVKEPYNQVKEKLNK